MQNQTARADKTDKKDGLFFYLVVLTAFFILLEISFFIQCNKFYLSDYKLVTETLMVPASVLPGILFFIATQLVVHLVFCVFTWIVAALVAQFFQLISTKKVMLGIVIWMLGILIVLSANHYWYPNSKFSELTSLVFFNKTFNEIVLISLMSLYSLLILLALFEFFRTYRRLGKFFVVLGLMVFVATFYRTQPPMRLIKGAGNLTQPNIILVGIDSVRPDFLGFFGHEINTPFMDAFLIRSTVFNEAVTPLARTFPSWTTILTGQYPRQHGIRHDLATQEVLRNIDTLPKMLGRLGYETIFATDEVRFSNIDKNFGFDKIISPPMGLNDFLLGSFNDFPLSNLIVNTNVGLWLFPHSYGNRPVHFTYDPNSFLQLVKPVLEGQSNKPIFLAIHFCLPHTPYAWRERLAPELNAIQHYEASIERVDRQVGDFFAMLASYHLLEHAIVVLLSDHGEGLEMPGDRLTEHDLFQTYLKVKKEIPLFYPPVLDHEGVNQSAGHGTDVLGLTQYHTLLAFKLYGVADQQYKVIPGVVSLIDIKPTLLGLLGIASPHAEGESLVEQIMGAESRVGKQRHIFLESDFSPEAIRTVYPDTRKVVLEGIQLFQIDPLTTRLFVKASMAEMIVNSKQFADIYQEWMLALYPQNEKYRMPILVNLVSGEWTNDLNSKFAKHSPAQAMLTAMKLFYGNEINAVQTSDKEKLSVR